MGRQVCVCVDRCGRNDGEDKTGKFGGDVGVNWGKERDECGWNRTSC